MSENPYLSEDFVGSDPELAFSPPQTPVPAQSWPGGGFDLDPDYAEELAWSPEPPAVPAATAPVPAPPAVEPPVEFPVPPPAQAQPTPPSTQAQAQVPVPVEASVQPPAPVQSAGPVPAASHPPATQGQPQEPVASPQRPAQVEHPVGAIIGGKAIRPVPGNEQALEGLLSRLMDDECSEVICNGPAEVMVKINGQRYADQYATFTTVEAYHASLNEVLNFADTPARIDGHNVLVEGQLEIPSENPSDPPMLGRIHILAPPLVPHAKVTIAKKARWSLTLDGMVANQSLTPGMASFLKAAAKARLTYVVAGPTGSGKTTLLQAMCRHFDLAERIIVVEDTPELRLLNGDTVYLTARQGQPGATPSSGVVSTEWLVRAANRMRMDRIIIGEVRGAEMADWLIAANSGAEGSAVTLHADSPRRALDKMLFLATKADHAPGENTLRREIAATVDLIVQTGLIDGRHVVTAISEVSNVVRDNQVISASELVAYDRALQGHIVRNPPSDELSGRIRAAGVPIDPSWYPGTR